MTLVIGAFFLLTLWWARRDWLTWVLLLCMAGIIVAFWFIAHGVALQYLVLFLVRTRTDSHSTFVADTHFLAGCHVVSLLRLGHLRRFNLVGVGAPRCSCTVLTQSRLRTTAVR